MRGQVGTGMRDRPRVGGALALGLWLAATACAAPAAVSGRGATRTPADGTVGGAGDLGSSYLGPSRPLDPILISSTAPPAGDDPPYSLGLDDPPVGAVWQIWLEGGYRNFQTDEADTGIASDTYMWAVTTGPIIPTRWGQAFVPSLYIATSFVESDGVDGGWRVLSPGVGFRYLFIAQRWGDFYAHVDVAYTTWRYSGDSFPGTRREPDDAKGRDLGAGLGGELFVTDWLGLGAGVTYRDYRGDDHFRVTWIDASVQAALRF